MQRPPDARNYLQNRISQFLTYVTYYIVYTLMHNTFTITSGHVKPCVSYDCYEALVFELRDTFMLIYNGRHYN